MDALRKRPKEFAPHAPANSEIVAHLTSVESDAMREARRANSLADTEAEEAASTSILTALGGSSFRR